jgi:glycosyltransferase involved in cell wall biosynthesis
MRAASISSVIVLDVIVCTYNRAADLNRTLAALAGQMQTDNVRWSVLVIDNASTDRTSTVVEAWQAIGMIPGLRRIVHRDRGLTPARVRGVRETTGEWIAFLQEDVLPAVDWIAATGRAIAAQPDAGGFGGKVILDWVRPPPAYLRSFGWCFAEQDHGPDFRELDALVGAGMVLRRAALQASGWTERPLLVDGRGKPLIAGGDVEMTQRVRSRGYRLWYAPECVLRHRIAPERATRRHLIGAAYGFGAAAAEVSALVWSETYRAWTLNAQANTRRFPLQTLRWLRPLSPNRSPTAALADAAFALGFARGVAAVQAMPTAQRAGLVGAARVVER